MEKIHNPERIPGESQLAYRQRQKLSSALAGRVTGFWNPRRQGTFVTGGIPLNGKVPAMNRQQRRTEARKSTGAR